MRAPAATALILASLGCATSGQPQGLWALITGGEEHPPLVEVPPATPLPAPRGLQALTGELRSVALRWEPVLAAHASGYVVERATPGQERFQRIAVLPDRFQTAYVDRGEGQDPNGQGPGGLADGTSYRYRIRAFDGEGRLGRLASEEVEATTAPPPAPPAGLRAYSHLPRRVALTWQPPQDPRVSEYVVYRSPSAGGEYDAIARVSGRHRTHYLDEGLGDLRVFYYRVAAVNKAGGEGTPSEAVRAVTKAEPLPPVELRVVEQRLGANHLAWNANVETDVASYRILRWRTGERSPQVVATLRPPLTDTWDEAVAAGEVVTYRVVARDRDGLESDPSEAAQVVSKGYELEAEADDEGVELRWRERRDEGLVSARVLRDSWLGWQEVGRASKGRYRDHSVERGRRYRYRVVLEREDGRPAPSSRVIEIAVPPSRAGAR